MAFIRDDDGQALRFFLRERDVDHKGAAFFEALDDLVISKASQTQIAGGTDVRNEQWHVIFFFGYPGRFVQFANIEFDIRVRDTFEERLDEASIECAMAHPLPQP